MRPGPRNLITDVAGLRVGNAEDLARGTGVTVVTADAPFVASVSVQGGAPGTRETDLLAPEATVGAVDALVLTGGSAFGLSAAEGVMAALKAARRGFEAGGHRIPIVPAAVIFDLYRADALDWEDPPWRALGRRAAEGAAADFAIGTSGAGTGAMTAEVRGGLGSASIVTPDFATGALVAVNPYGSVLQDGGPEFRAGPLEQGGEFGGLGPGRAEAGAPALKFGDWGNSVIAVVATDLALTKAEAARVAVMAQDGLARAIAPAHTPRDGDTVFAAATGHREMPADRASALGRVGHAAATALARAIARGVFAARALPGDLKPAWSDVFSREGPG